MHPLQAMFSLHCFRIFKVRIAFEIASTPVKAELPDANALSNKNKLIPATGVPIGVCKVGDTCPVKILYIPTPININSAKTNK